MDLSVVVLAAGQGTRMRSPLPKVLHPIGGKPMLAHVIDTAKQLEPTQIIIVYGFEGGLIKQAFLRNDLTWVEQPQRLGTGDAVAKALSLIPEHHRVITLYGDVPLIQTKTLEKLLEATPPEAVGLLTIKTNDPTGLGRIIRNQKNQVEKIVEERDATEVERQINEVNTGIFLVNQNHLNQWLPKLQNTNASGEYYLTDIIQMAVDCGVSIETTTPCAPEEVLGVNDKSQLVMAERCYQRHLAERLLREGTYIVDPARFDVRGALTVDSGVTIDVNVVFEGDNSIQKNSHIGPNCVLIDCKIGENVRILANSYLEGVTVGAYCTVGPFARLRPGTVLDEAAHVGNFVEIKNSHIGKQSKISHLSYIGDTQMGMSVNMGAGSITCNYDGANKFKTIIEDGAFIGSDTQLIAPVVVGENATIAAGSTIRKNVPSHKLTISHKLAQRALDGWRRPQKISKNSERSEIVSEDLKNK